jgi:HK97 family phage major capsid protein
MSPPVIPAAPAASPTPTAEVPAEYLNAFKAAAQELIAPIRAMYEKAVTTNAPPVGGEERAPITGREAADGTGLTLIRVLMINAKLQLENGGVPMPGAEARKAAAAEAKKLGYGRVEKIFTSGTLTAGGSFVQDTLMVSEWIELLRNKTVIRKAGARQITVPGGGALRIPRQTGAATAYWVGENEPATLSEPTTEQATWSPKKLMVLVPVSNRMVRAVGAVDAEMFIRDDALNVHALEEDRAFLRGLGSDNSPRGIRYRVAAANVYAETVTTEGSPTLTEIDNELEGMLKLLETGNALNDQSKPVWFMSANPKYKLRSIRDTNGNAVYVDEMNQGKLKGHPFFSTQQIPQNLGGDGDESELYLQDMNSVVISDFQNMEVTFHPDGAHVVGGTQITGIGQDASILRVVSETDINLRHDVSGAVVTELSWGYA